MKQNIEVSFTAEVHDDYGLFSGVEKKLFRAAKTACNEAYAPYSNFGVGAAVLLDNGLIYKGSNQENAAYPSGLCAERVALYYASANHPNVRMKAIAITVQYQKHNDFDEIVSPCGACRQVMAEYEYKFGQPIKIYLLGRNEKVCVIDSVSNILPFLFSGDILKAFKKS